MQIIEFSNGQEIEVFGVTGMKQHISGVTRDVLKFVIHGEADLTEMLELFSNQDATRSMIIESNNEKFVYNDYIVFGGAELLDEVIEVETPDTPEVKERRLYVTLAQETHMEKQIYVQAAALNKIRIDSAVANTEMLELVLALNGGNE